MSQQPNKTKKPGGEVVPDRVLLCAQGYIYLTATALAVIGLFLLKTVWATRNSSDWWLASRNPLFGCQNSTLLLGGCLLHLGVAAFLFATRNTASRTLAILWLGLNHLLYYVGIGLLQPNALVNTRQFFGWRLQVSPATVDLLWKSLPIYLLLTSAVFLILLWRRSARLGNAAWFSQWQEARKQSLLERATSPKKTETAADQTKNQCPHCGQKIAFPLSRVGEELTCPKCAGLITLRAPPATMAREAKT